MDKEPSEAAFRRVDELIDKESCYRAFALFVDKVDKVAREVEEGAGYLGRGVIRDKARSLMLPDEPDPLREVLAAAIENSRSGEKLYEVLRAELAKRGGKIVWEEPK